jgi:succinate dehydrogenase/fumarate reductase cytochrome b subunit
MNDAALKASIALILVSALFAGAVVIWLKRKSMSSFLQLLGATGFVAVVLTHVFEALRVFPWMGWGSGDSIGHYFDLFCAILGFLLFPAGYLVHALKMRAEKNGEKA